jgi:site-specific recombinase XerC
MVWWHVGMMSTSWRTGRSGGTVMPTANLPAIRACRPPWNRGRIVGQKRPLLPKHVWAIRVRLEIANRVRDLALFNTAIDSKLRGCDLVKLKVADVFSAGQVKERASTTQSKTRHPVRFEITEGTRKSIAAWLKDPAMIGSEHLWPGRFHDRLHISTRQYARLVRDWVTSIGLEPSAYGTYSMRRTKVAQIYRKTGNLRAGQLLLGHTKMDSTVRYLGVELEDAIAISEAVKI